MAKTDLVPIKIKICAKMVNNQRQADWPKLNKISSDIRKEMGWSVFIDMHGIGLHYDKVSNLGTGADCGWACTCVPKDFAEAAVAVAGDKVQIIDEAAFEDFYDNRSHVNEPAIKIDSERLVGLKAAIDLGIIDKTDPEYLKAVDPNCDCPGYCKNKHKTWQDCKACCVGLTIHAAYAKP